MADMWSMSNEVVFEVGLRDELSKNYDMLIPLFEKYPLLPLEKAAPTLQEIAQKMFYPAITDGQAVYYSNKNLIKWGNDMKEHGVLPETAFIPTSSYSYEARICLIPFIVQQYLHLLYQHTRPARLETEKLDLKYFQIATDIEVNRLKAIPRNSLCYQTTPNADLFPETKHCLSLKQTYNALIQENEEEQKSQSGGSGDAQPNSSGEEESDSDSKKDSQAGTTNRSQNGSPQDITDVTPSDSEKLSHARQHVMEKLPPQDYLENTDCDLLGDPSTAARISEVNLQKLSHIVYDRWHNKSIRRQMRKLRGALEGEISRKKRSTFARPARRTIAPSRLLKKGIAKDICGQPKILVALDMSGSMDAVKLEQMLEATANTFIDLGRPTQGSYACVFNERIITHVPLHRYADILGEYSPYGGTNYGAVIDLAIQLGVDVVLEIGDGEQSLRYSDRREEVASGKIRWYDVIIDAQTPAHHFLTTHIIDDILEGYPRHVIAIDKRAAILCREAVAQMTISGSTMQYTAEQTRTFKQYLI